MKIFGREPAVYVAVVEAFLALLVSFQLDYLTAAQATNILAVMVAAGGIVTAWTTADALLGALTGFGRAALVLAVSYGLNLSQEQVGLSVAVIAAISGLWLRTQTSPTVTAITHA